MNAIVETINAAGREFVDFALPMLVQSTVLILVLLVVDVLLRKRVRAVFRYWIWMLVLIKLVLPPSLWSPVSVGRWFGDELHVSADALLEDDQPPMAEPPSTALQILSQPVPLPIEPLAGVPEPRAATADRLVLPAAPSDDGAIEPEAASVSVEAERPTPAAPVTALDWRGFILLAWTAVVVALLLLLLQRAVFVRGLVAQAGQASASMQNVLDECRTRVGLGRAVALKISPNATSPAVCGLARPVILIPRNLAPKISRHDLHAVLLHELAHVKRGDLWISLAQTLLQIVYFYNPLLWLANAVIRRVREKAVDEAVLVAMGESASDYPESLVNVAKLAFKRRPVLSLRLIGVVESKSALAARIKHILSRPFPRTAKLGGIGLLTLFALAAVLLPMAKAREDEEDAVLSRLVVLPNCAVRLSDINGQHLPVLDFASERIIVLPAVENERDLLRMTGPQDQGDVVYCYDSEKDKPRITFLGSAGLNGESVSDEYEALTLTPMRMPFETTVTTRGNKRFAIRIIRADEHGCVIQFRPLGAEVSTPKAVLANGITVELLGVCEHPSAGRQWWYPDGSTMKEAPRRQSGAHVYAQTSESAYEFVVRLHDLPKGAAVILKTEPTGARTQGPGVEGLRWLAATLPDDLRQCQLLCGIAAGAWETLAQSSGAAQNISGTALGGVMFSEASERADGALSITTTDDIIERSCRVVALAKDGRTIEASEYKWGAAGKARQTTSRFDGISASEIAEFQFQTRPWTWIEFENVSLRPGRGTNVEVRLPADQGLRVLDEAQLDESASLPLTRRTEMVMPLAEQEARRLNHSYVGTEHILVALARDSEAVSARVLAGFDVDVDTLRAEMAKLVKPGSAPVRKRNLPRTPRAKRVMTHAQEEARALGHDYIGTEHILLGVMSESQGLGAQMLQNLGLTPQKVKSEVFSFVQSGRETGGRIERVSELTEPGVTAQAGTVALPASLSPGPPTLDDRGVFLLEQRDSDGASRGEDRLYLIDADGGVRSIFAELDLCETIGGAHMMAVDESRRVLWVAENAGNRLWKFDLATGKVAGCFPGLRASAVAVDPKSGNVWIAAEPELIRVVSPEGKILATYEIPGYDIAYSPCDGSFWVVGKEVCRVDPAGKVVARVTGVGYAAVSVSIDPRNGEAWVAIASHSQRPKSRNELWHVDAGGAVRHRLDLDELRPYCVRVDPDHAVVWVGCRGTTLCYDTSGNRLASTRGESAFSIALSGRKEVAYLADRTGAHEVAVLDSGHVKSRSLLSDVSDAQRSQKWIARVTWAQAMLPTSPDMVDLVPRPKETSTPEITDAASRAESADKLLQLGMALLIHASDHKDQLPSALSDVRAEMSEPDFWWCREHAEYIGQGVKRSARALDDRAVVVAYDKTILQHGEATNVLFLDPHVEFLTADRLRDLAIPAAGRFDKSGLEKAGVDTDGDGLSDFQERHKYLTDPTKKDSDDDGTADGDWNERREYTYSVRTVLRFMPPLDADALNDDFQDARLLEQTDDYIEIEVVHYPLATSQESIGENPHWRQDYAHMSEYLAPGVTTNWDARMQRDLRAALKADSIDIDALTDKQVVEQVSRWLTNRSRSLDKVFTTYYVDYPDARPRVYPGLEEAFRREFERDSDNYDWTIAEHFDHELLGKGMFYNRTHGSCTSTAVYLATALRALGIPTRIVLATPAVDASDREQILMVKEKITHHRVREIMLAGLRRSSRGFTNHTFNEVYVGGRWVRLDYHTLGPPILGVDRFGLQTHLYTVGDLSDVNFAPTWGWRYARGERDEVFKHSNPYSAVDVSDLFGAHSNIPNPAFTAQELSSGGLPNIFIFEPLRKNASEFSIWDEILPVVKDRTGDKTGRFHQREYYDNIFEGVWTTKPGDILVLLFSLDTPERVPAGYEDLLPEPWPQIESRLKRGESVELSGSARDMKIILLAASTRSELKPLIRNSELLRALGTSARQQGDAPSRPAPTSSSSPFVVRVDGDVEIELLGVCTYPGADRKWWRPDGGSLPEAPCSIPASSALHPSDGETVYGFVAQVAHVPDDARGAVKVPSARTQASYDTAWAVDGTIRKDIWYAEAILPKNRKTCTVRCEVATDIWAEFENVSLRPGGSTNLVVKVGSSGEQQGPRRIVLPDVDHEAVMLDLASGQLLPVPRGRPPEELLDAIKESGKGDLVLDSRSLILVRGATSRQAVDGPEGLVKAVKIDSNLPETVTIASAEGRRYEITVLSIDDEACTLTYSRSPVEPMQTRSPSVVTVHADEPSGALAFRVAVSREEVPEAAVDKYVQALLTGLPRSSGDYGWFEVRPNVTFSPELVTQEHEGKVYLLLRTDAANVMRSGDGWALERVKAATDAMGRPAVRVWFDDKGGERLYTLTQANVKKVLAILVEGRVVAAPEVMSPVRDAVLIVGNYTQREIEDMVNVLRPKPPEQPVAGESKDRTEPAVDVLATLRQLALGVVLFARDHEGDLPATLTDIERYVPDRAQFSWMRANVTYVGKGNLQREAKPYEVPIAYRMAPDSVGGAYVAFMDGHAILVPTERCKELGIEPVGGQDKGAFRVQGIVTDECDRPLAGVEITASCGWNTLMPTGQTVTDANGRYTLAFEPGYRRPGDTYPDDVGVQAATIGARKSGFYEANLCRQGNLAMAGKPLASGERQRVARFAGVVLPHQPREVNFEMQPAARVEGELVDTKDRPLAQCTIQLGGEELYPSTGVLATARTDSNGRFTIEDVPLESFWFEYVRNAPAQSESVRFATAGLWRVRLKYTAAPAGQPRLAVSAVHVQEAGAEAADEPNGELPPEPVRAIRKMLGQWVAGVRAGDLEAIRAAYPPDYPRAVEDAEDFRELLSLNPGWEFSLLSVAWNDEAAMAVSGKLGAGDPKDESEPVVLVWNIEKLQGRCVITDIDLEEIAGLQRENAFFQKEHPGARVWYLEPGPPAVPRDTGSMPLGGHALSFDGVDDCLVVPASASLTLKPPFFVEVWARPDLSVLPQERFDPRKDPYPAMDFMCQGAAPKSAGPANLDSKSNTEALDGWPVPSALSHPLPQPLQSGGFATLLEAGVFVVDETSHAAQTGLIRTSQLGVDRPGWTHYYFELRRDNLARERYVPAEGPLVIGRVVRNGFPFKGRIAEVRIWNKELSMGDMRYVGSTSVTGNEPNLVACWTFEEGSGQIVRDISPNANHAYLGGSEDADDADPKWVGLAQDEASAPNEIAGRVVDADGKAVAGAQVAFCTETVHVTIQDGRLSHPRASDMEKGEITETGAQGLFRFDSEAPADFSLIAAHDDGFALVELESFRKDREIRLKRWGRIEGQLAPGRTAQGNQISMCGLPNSTWRKHRYDFRYKTKCDGQGRFAFERVPAGRFEVGYLASTGRGSASVTSRTPVMVDSGRTATMKLGGEGRPVIGKLVAPQGYHGPIYFGQGLRSLSTSRPEEPRPENYDQMTRREQQAWHSKWRQTPEAEAFYEAMWSNLNWRHYCFSIQQDGSFRIEDLIPGKYDLNVWLEERFTGQGRPEEIGGYNGIVEVPPMAEVSTDEPLDLGELTLSMRHPLHVGDAVPQFEAETLDGKAISLADYRGRHVLLSFWAPTFHPELERLKELHAEYGRTGQLQIIGLGGTDTRDEVTSYINEHDIPWPQIYFGSDWNADLFKKLGGQVQIILIDPEGKVVATWLRGDELSDTVREAVAFAWQRTDGYAPPDPEGFFPDDAEAGKRLDALFKAVDKDRRSDEEILSTVRRGFRRTKEYRTNILRWIGNRYVWGADPQNAEAIEIMYHAVGMERHYAIYFGLSVVKDKTPNILRALAEICMKGEDVGRITWGVGAQRDELVAYIKPYLDDADPQKRETASVLIQHFEGKLDFDRWKEDKRLEQAKVEFAAQLPQFKQTLLTGDSRVRREVLATIQREGLVALLDDSFVPAFQACGTDPDRKVRGEVASMAGNRWVWSAQEQNPDAIALMLELASDKVRDVRYDAVYYGLSVVRDKTEPVLRRLVELALSDHENNLYGRIVWGLKGPMRTSPEPFEEVLAEHLEASESNDHLAASVYLLYHDVLQKEPPAEWNLARIKQQYPDDLFTVTFSAKEPFAPASADALWNEFAKTLPEKAAAKRVADFRRGKPFVCVAQVRSQQQADVVRQSIEGNPRLGLGQVRPVPLWAQLYEEEKRGFSSFPPDDEAIASLFGPKAAEPGPIQQQIDAAAPGDTIRLEPGLYKESLIINKPLTLEGAGWDKTVIMKEKLVIESFEDIQRMMFQRLSQAESEAQREEMAAQMRKALAEHVSPTALRVEGARDVVIRGIKFTSPGGHVEGTSMSLPIVVFDRSGVRFEDCAVIGGPGDGIRILNAADVKIERTLVAAVWGTGVAVGDRTVAPSRSQLLDCDMRNCHYAGVRIAAGNDDTRIERCRISGAAWHGIRYDSASPRVVNNLIFGNARSGIYASGDTAAVVSGNLFHANEMCGVSCWFQNRDTIEGNTFVENQRSGLEILGASKPSVRRNIFYTNPTGVFLGNIGSKSRFAQSDGKVALDTNLFWANENDVAWRPDANTVETIVPDQQTHTLQTDPRFAAAATKDFSLVADSVARQKDIGVAAPIPFAGPWPLQPEERAIIPKGDTRDSRLWRHAN